MALKMPILVVLDLPLTGIVNGGVPAAASIAAAVDGAIAQLGERVVRNDEVGGSIPPGSTSDSRAINALSAAVDHDAFASELLDRRS